METATCVNILLTDTLLANNLFHPVIYTYQNDDKGKNLLDSHYSILIEEVAIFNSPIWDDLLIF